MSRQYHVAIAGAGIAGLTAALAFVRKGWTASVHERATVLEEIGAGIQLSPNATRLLDRLGVLERLRPVAVQPDAVVLRQAATFDELARIPLGVNAEHRWGSPYLTIHRADLQAALLAEAMGQSEIDLNFGRPVRDFALDPPRLEFAGGATRGEAAADLVVAADGVWSTVRGLGGKKGESRFIGQMAWRRTISREEAER
ncbi:salicylate hydroxylase, partial [Salmonella enterica subsp. enterica]|nr:salicylate hydroxylase [Salmonella enterica subsp. enterica serovar Enteritidis]